MRLVALLLALCVAAPPVFADGGANPRKKPKVVRKAKPAPKPTPTPTPEPPPAPLAFDEVPVPPEPVIVPEPEPVATPVPTPPEGMRLSVLGGGLVSMASGLGGEVEPLARLSVEGPIALPGIGAHNLPRVFVTADLTALPGDTVSFTAPDTFRALEFQIGVAQRIAPDIVNEDQRIRTSLFAAAGFTTRLSGDTEPRDRTPRFGILGVRLEERKTGSHVSVGFCADQRLDGRYQPAICLGGAIQLERIDSGSLEGARAMFIGGAILGLDLRYVGGSALPARRDVVRIGVAVGK